MSVSTSPEATRTSEAALLRVEDLQAGYGPVKVLHGLDFSVGEGETAVILGANGAGKTTTLRALSGMVHNRGKIVLGGEDITHASTDAIVRRGVAHVPQGRGTFMAQTVEENLRLGAYARRDGDVGEDMDRMFQLWPRLKERRNQAAGSLSGGEQQMLAIARALMLRPKLLLLDEPSLGLAPIIVQDLFGTLADLKRETQTTMLIVEQNAILALSVGDYAYVLETGRIVFGGEAEKVKNDETIRRSYLGY